MTESKHMKTLEELKAAADQAAAEYEQAKAAARADKLAEVKALIAEFDFSQSELFKSKSTRAPKTEKAPKTPQGVTYEKDGQKWGGKGRPPGWVIAAREDGTLDKYEIKPASAS